MKATYRYRIYPNKGQRILLEKTFGCNRVVWNDALEKVKATKKGEKWPTTNQLMKSCITDAKKTEEREWLKEVPNVCLQQSIRDLGSAQSAFFDSKNGKRKGRKVGFPRFKSKNGNQSARFTRPKHGSCHALHDRDKNAAINIAAVGAGSAHDAKRTRRECQTSKGRYNRSCEANLVETSNVN